jgi:hypothetical protein
LLQASFRRESPFRASLVARLVGVMGLSSDPEKRRRQLAGLAKGAEARAARLRAQLAELEQPAASEAPSEAASEAPAAPTSEAASEAAQGARLVRGSYGDLPAAPTPDDDVDDLADDLEDELEPEEEQGPSGLARFAAGVLGVKP